MVDRRVLGLNVRKAREKSNLTQEQLGTAVGVTHATINRLENGKQNVTVDILDKISKRLGIETFSLFSKEPLVQYSVVREEHASIHLTPDNYEKIKLFDDPLSL
ncbi:MAG: helix-turn-helix transcriptional regulator, partial [Acidobacteriota bacterium]